MAAPKGNKFALGLDNSGRPPIYSKPEDLYNKILEYFEYIEGDYEKKEILDGNDQPTGSFEVICTRQPEPLTIIGLSIYLGFSSKGTLYEYAKKEEFSDYIKRALSFVEQHYEEMLLSKVSTGAIFALKNMGWKDKMELDNKSSDGSMATKPNIIVNSDKTAKEIDKLIGDETEDR